MNSKLNSEIASLIRAHRWQEVLRKLPPNEPVPLTFDTASDMDNCRSVASRLNSKGEDENRYSFSGLNYATKTVCAIAKPKRNDQEN